MENCAPSSNTKVQLYTNKELDEVECFRSSKAKSSKLPDCSIVATPTIITTPTAIASPSPLAATASIAATIPASSLTQKKRKFPSVKEFVDASDDNVKRKIKPVQKWCELEENKLYLARKVIKILIKGGKEEASYVELENKEGEILNVWLTSIIKTELENFTLENENVYIMPLGEKKSRESGNTYFDFVVKEY